MKLLKQWKSEVQAETRRQASLPPLALEQARAQVARTLSETPSVTVSRLKRNGNKPH